MGRQAFPSRQFDAHRHDTLWPGPTPSCTLCRPVGRQPISPSQFYNPLGSFGFRSRWAPATLSARDCPDGVPPQAIARASGLAYTTPGVGQEPNDTTVTMPKKFKVPGVHNGADTAAASSWKQRGTTGFRQRFEFELAWDLQRYESFYLRRVIMTMSHIARAIAVLCFSFALSQFSLAADEQVNPDTGQKVGHSADQKITGDRPDASDKDSDKNKSEEKAGSENSSGNTSPTNMQQPPKDR